MRIHKHNHLDQRLISYDGDLAAEGPRSLVFRAVFDLPTAALPHVTIESGDIFMETFYFDRWYNVFEISTAAGALKGWYANVTRPARLIDVDGSTELVWDDLFLDVWMSPGGVLTNLDEDEFDNVLDLSALDRVSAFGALAQARAELRRVWRARTVAAIAAGFQARGWTLGSAESCTGGQIGDVLTEFPGISSVYAGGVISYSNALKRQLLGVRPETLDFHGAVSAETAREMAAGARERLGVDVAVSVTGIAGPGGASADKPVGLTFIGLATPGGTRAEQHVWEEGRSENKGASVDRALMLLREALQE